MRNLAAAFLAATGSLFAQMAPIPGPGRVSAAPPAGWTLAQSQTGSPTSGSSISTAAMSNPLTAGSLLAVFLWDNSGNSGAFGTPTDTAGNTCVDSGTGVQQAGFGPRFQVFLCPNSHTTSSNVVTSATSSLFVAGIAVAEFTGGTTRTADGHSTHSGVDTGPTADNISAGSITTTANTDLLLSFFINGHGPASAGTGYTQITTGDSKALAQYGVQTSAGSVTIFGTNTWGFGDDYSGLAVAVKI